MQHQIEVSGMTCNHCRASVAQALNKVPGVTLVNVDLASGRATVTTGPEVVVGQLTAAIEAQGYGAREAAPA